MKQAATRPIYLGPIFYNRNTEKKGKDAPPKFTLNVSNSV
jgi:hypothetical protein